MFNQHSLSGQIEEDWVSGGYGAWVWDGEHMRTARKQTTRAVLAPPPVATSTRLSSFFLLLSIFLSFSSGLNSTNIE